MSVTLELPEMEATARLTMPITLSSEPGAVALFATSSLVMGKVAVCVSVTSATSACEALNVS